MPAPYHTDHEAIRKTLYSLNILDTPIEERFQRITRMVCASLGVPVSAFSIIDGERQWFKSIQGMDATENSRAESFCAYTILGDDVMVVSDARKDVRFSNNPLVKNDPNIAFYAGCPVRAPDGRNIGSLCAIDTKVRDLSPDQLQVLRDLAAMLESELKSEQMSKTQYDLIHDLNAAQRLLLIDPATRLWNRAGIEDILKREWGRSENKDANLSFALIDITNAAEITKNYGRNTTDALIMDISKRLLTAVRSEDSLARLDGDRFAVLMIRTDPSQADEKIREICSKITDTTFTWRNIGIPFSVNFGVVPTIGNPAFGFNHIMAEAEASL